MVNGQMLAAEMVTVLMAYSRGMGNWLILEVSTMHLAIELPLGMEHHGVVKEEELELLLELVSSGMVN